MRPLTLSLLLFSVTTLQAQTTVTITFQGADPQTLNLVDPLVPVAVTEVPNSAVSTFSLTFAAAVDPSTTVTLDGNDVGTLDPANTVLTVSRGTVVEDLRGHNYIIMATAGSLGQFTLADGKPKEKDCLPEPISVILKRIAPEIRSSQYGLMLPVGSRYTAYGGRKYVHLFFDHRGQPLFSTVPQGISNMQYVVHVVYLRDKLDRAGTSYSVQQTQGEFIDALVFQNSDQANPPAFVRGLSEGEECEHQWEWTTTEFLLRTSTNNIEFKIYRNTDGEENGRVVTTSDLLSTYSIPMSKVYHGSIDVGFVNSTLSNPTFTLESSSDGDTTVVKRAESGNRGIVTLMATFYTSPVMLFKRKGSIPDFKRSGRNFLDDHKWYERIFPCVGVGISDKAFENLFLGMNWEFARGGSLWLGYHYGRVNVYNEPEDFEFGVTPTTEDDFNLRTDTKWVWSDFDSPSFGVNLDLRLVTRLFSGGQTPSVQ